MKLDISEIIARKQRRKNAIAVHAVEGLIFTAEQNAMFEMFDRENFTDEERIAYIKARYASDNLDTLAAE